MLNTVSIKGEEKDGNLEMKQTIYRVMSKAIFILFLVLAVLLIGARFLGFTPYSVLSPSMTPKYPVGSLIYIKHTPTKDISVGDDITFVLDESLNVVTHQVVEIDEKHEFFTTKGIANDSQDASPVYYKNILGKVHFSVQYLGYISDVVTSPVGLVIFGVGLILWVVLIYRHNRSRKENKDDEARTLQTD